MPPLRLRVDTRDPRPLWRQIEDELLHEIGAGSLAVDDPLPSVRDLARQLRVNPNTVAKVYQRLREAGVLGVRRGEGTFVSRVPSPMPARERSRRLRDTARMFAAQARVLGASDEEIQRALERELASNVLEREA
jgi:GntR family transcriptional regulator